MSWGSKKVAKFTICNTCIRSICITNNKAYTQAAGGIVADSIPEMEFRETENKMRSSLSAMAQCGDLQ